MLIKLALVIIDIDYQESEDNYYLEKLTKKQIDRDLGIGIITCVPNNFPCCYDRSTKNLGWS